jgi:hypothetical protein
MRTTIHRAAILLLIVAGSCESADGGEEANSRLFMFGMRGIPAAEGRFVAATSDPVVLAKLEAQLALPASQRSLHINGPIASGSGSHNLSWSWHFVPGQWDLVELSIELCDGTPKLVEDDLDYWLETVGAFCPWSSYVQEELESTP